MQNLKEDLISNDDSTVTKIRFHVIKIVLDQGLMRYLKKIIYDGRKTFLLRRD